ncbi:HD domain-containing protein [Enterobacter sp. Ap-916]|uniref:HD domain-containing protein n=1 Tax=Enterobacteriaceae TaxID=543 RepID=UPI00141E3957|nr:MULTISPECIES: HD domain-containing protein [unclassified Enterobacter]NIF57942.1 HD domain-containing protein [Enterobacter sp. Ap-867]NIG28116.1 HD domain-containing protein [Enterobacter sp. Ap-916]
MSLKINGIAMPDTKMAREATQLVRDTESDLLFHHSSRVYYWAALAGQRRELKVDHELLYIGCMFHDMGLTHEHCSCDRRFEVDGAFAAQDFMRQYGVSQADIDKVWTAIALHTTPGIPEFMAPEIALVTAGVEMDVLGIDYDKFSAEHREQVVKLHPRPAAFKEEIIQAFYDGIKNKPATTFGNVKADVIRDKEPAFEPLNFCSIIRASRWAG